MLQFVHMQLLIRFSDGPLAMHPFGLDAVQPGVIAPLPMSYAACCLG
jgi:hypothetical protein